MDPIIRQHTLKMLVRSLQNSKAAHERNTPTRKAECKLLRSNRYQRYSHEEAQREEYSREEEAYAEYLKALLVVQSHDFLWELGFERGAHGGHAEVYSHEGLGFHVAAGAAFFSLGGIASSG